MKKLLSGAVLAVAVFSGCSSNQIPPTSHNTTMHPAVYTGTTDAYVNGEIPPEKVGGSFKTLLSQTIVGVTHFAGEVTRKPGERSMVHYMTYTVTSCVQKGQATLVMDGSDPVTYKAGQCYTMPAGIKGYVANRGKTTLKLLDVNTMPAGEDSMVMLEQ